MKMKVGYKMKPKDGSDGQDSIYIDDNIMAVMDGVGGWLSEGIDSKLYSQRLADLMEQKYP